MSEPTLDEVVNFILGRASLDGVWFGNHHPTEKGLFWWRKHLFVAVQKQQAEVEALREQVLKEAPEKDEMRAEILHLTLEVEALRAFHSFFIDRGEALFAAFGMPAVDLFNAAARPGGQQ